jgi:uncharacterized membrane protein
MIRRRRGLRLTAVVLIVVVLGIAGYVLAGHRGADRATTAASPAGRFQLADLERRGAPRSLVSLFNQELGTPRLVLLVSPT